MQKSKIEIEIEKFWKDITKQARKNAFLEEKEREKEERKNSTSKSIRLSKAKYHGVQENSTNAENSSNQTYSFQSSNFAENKPIKAIFKRISSSTTASGAGRTGAYIGRINEDDKSQMLFYRGFCGNFEGEEEQLEEIRTYNNEDKAFINSCFEEEILRMSPTIGGQNEIESHHYIFSLPEYTRTKNNKVITKDKLNRILEEATINTIHTNEILSNRAIQVAIHEENHAHINFSATNFDGEKDLKFITKKQQMDILRDFSKECRNLGLNVEIPRENSPILNLQELNTITSIEYKQNNQIKAITLQNEQGATKRLMAVSINDFMQKNGLKINDKISIEIQKNKFGRNFYKLLEKEESQQEQEPPKIKVSEQKIELNSIQIAEAQRQIQEEIERKEREKEKIQKEREERERKEKEEQEEREKQEQKEILKDMFKNAKETIFYSKNLRTDKYTRKFNENNITKINNSIQTIEETIEKMPQKFKNLRNKNAKEIERILFKNERERTL